MEIIKSAYFKTPRQSRLCVRAAFRRPYVKIDTCYTKRYTS